MAKAINSPTTPAKLTDGGATGIGQMAKHSIELTTRAKWMRGWALMGAGKTSEGYDLLSGIKLDDLRFVADTERPERLLMRVQSIIERQPSADAGKDDMVMEVLIRAAKRGDHEASDLLVFGDLGELPKPLLQSRGTFAGFA
jgi:hypothetical protein